MFGGKFSPQKGPWTKHSSMSDMTATSSAKSRSVKTSSSPVWGQHSHDEWRTPWSNQLARETYPLLQQSLLFILYLPSGRRPALQCLRRSFGQW